MQQNLFLQVQILIQYHVPKWHDPFSTLFFFCLPRCEGGAAVCEFQFLTHIYKWAAWLSVFCSSQHLSNSLLKSGIGASLWKMDLTILCLSKHNSLIQPPHHSKSLLWGIQRRRASRWIMIFVCTQEGAIREIQTHRSLNNDDSLQILCQGFWRTTHIILLSKSSNTTGKNTSLNVKVMYSQFK